MSELILIRHAQASFGHENYDNLSDLGHDQATLLGSLFDRLKIAPDRVIIGTQKRHEQTLENFNLNCKIDKHPGWNEYDFRGFKNDAECVNSFPVHSGIAGIS